MSEYRPDNWVLIQIKGEDPHYRVLGGWSGGYLAGNSWRLNSGVTKVEETDKEYLFYGSSGSCYSCNKESNIVRMNIAPTLRSLEKYLDGKMDVVGPDTDYMNIDWSIKGKEKNSVL